MNLPGRLVSGTIFTLVAAMAILLWTSEGTLRRDLEHDLANALEREARLIAAALPADSLGARAAIHRYSREDGYRITLIDPAGRVVAESNAPDEALGSILNHAGRPEVKAAFAGQVGVAIRNSPTFNIPLLYVAIAGGPGVVRVAAPYQQVDATVHRAESAVGWAALLALAVGILIALLAGRSVARPLTEITEAARAIAAGRPPRFPHSRIPDVESLVRALREMHGQLAERFDHLRSGDRVPTLRVMGIFRVGAQGNALWRDYFDLEGYRRALGPAGWA